MQFNNQGPASSFPAKGIKVIGAQMLQSADDVQVNVSVGSVIHVRPIPDLNPHPIRNIGPKAQKDISYQVCAGAQSYTQFSNHFIPSSLL